jgi:hypothetical protein
MQQQNQVSARGVIIATIILLSAIHAFGAHHIYDIWGLSDAQAAKTKLRILSQLG